MREQLIATRLGLEPAPPSHVPCAEQRELASELRLPITVQLKRSRIRLVLCHTRGYISETYITDDQFFRVAGNTPRLFHHGEASSKKPFCHATRFATQSFLDQLAVLESIERRLLFLPSAAGLRLSTLAGLGPLHPWSLNSSRLASFARYWTPRGLLDRLLCRIPPLPEVATRPASPWGIYDSLGLVRCLTGDIRTKSWTSGLGRHVVHPEHLIGGSWRSTLSKIDPKNEIWADHAFNYSDVGFRLYISLDGRTFKARPLRA